MLNGDAYRASIRDGRASYLDGKRVEDPGAHPLLKVSVDWVAGTYDRLYGPGDGPSPLYDPPRSADDLVAQMELLTASDPTAAVTAGCMSLRGVAPELGQLQPAYADRLNGFLDATRDQDRRVAAARADLGGLRVVERTAEGVVLRGAKQHVLGAAVVHDLVVVPEGDLTDDQAERAIACAIPINTPGLKLVNITPAPRSPDDRHFPISRVHSMADATVLFDDVLVPHDQVFLDGETSHAGSLAKTFGMWERARAAAEQADRAELLLGLAHTIADMNGLSDVDHIREKLSRLAVYASMCRAGWEAALAHAATAPDGAIVPDESFVYATLAHGSDMYSRMVGLVHDVGGASVITAPSVADYENEATHLYVEKYMSTGNNVRGEDRMKVFHLIRDLTGDTYAGWLKVTTQMIGGGVLAQRLAALDHYPMDAAAERVRETVYSDN